MVIGVVDRRLGRGDSLGRKYGFSSVPLEAELQVVHRSFLTFSLCQSLESGVLFLVHVNKYALSRNANFLRQTDCLYTDMKTTIGAGQQQSVCVCGPEPSRRAARITAASPERRSRYIQLVAGIKKLQH